MMTGPHDTPPNYTMAEAFDRVRASAWAAVADMIDALPRPIRRLSIVDDLHDGAWIAAAAALTDANDARAHFIDAGA